jgi:hypothetical protein
MTSKSMLKPTSKLRNQFRHELASNINTVNDIEAADSNQSPLCLRASSVEFEAARGDGEAPSLRRFTMTAYTGGPMQLAGWRYPVIVDLQGLQAGKQRRPILLDHTRDVDYVIGQTDSIAVLNNNLVVTGQVMGDSPKAKQVIQLNDRGFAWQASIGARTEQVEYVAEGKSTIVNGKEYSGPVNVARRATLGEVSFVVLGADDNTSAQIAANCPQSGVGSLEDERKDSVSRFSAWLALQGFDESTLDASQKDSMKLMFNTFSEVSKKPIEAITTSIHQPPHVHDSVAEVRAALALEKQRIAAIKRIFDGKYDDLEAKAIAEGWDEQKAELIMLRHQRPQAPAVHMVDRSINGTVLEAAVVTSAGLLDAEKNYDDKTLEAAHRRYRGSITLQELILEAAWANGYSGRNFRDAREVLRFAFHNNVQAGLSTIEVSGILSNVANKFLLEGFFSVERTWRNICAVRNVNDFKTITSYRLVGKDQYELIAPGGEIPSGTLGEEKYSNKADTYGLMLAIDRRDFINDDLGAITTVPRKLGRGSGLKINDVFWTVFMNNATFFTAGNKNFILGVNTALGIDGLTLGETTYMDQVDADGKPVGIMPQIMLVPTAISTMATQLYKSLEMRDNTANAKMTTSNPHQGKFRVEVSRYLGNVTFPGNSTKAWYLLADPNDLPLIEVAFLNGQESPTIETAEADFNMLGIKMRGYHDFGVALQDPRAGLKAKGEA